MSQSSRTAAAAAGVSLIALIAAYYQATRKYRVSKNGSRHLRWVARAGFKSFAKELNVAVRLALQCGEAITAVSTCPTTAPTAVLKDGKHGIDPQTATDLANEQLIMRTLSTEFPAHAIIGEETSAAAGGQVPPIDPAVPTWIIDPIDGTQNFVSGLPLAVVSIGLCCNGVPTLGVIYDPYRDELFVGIASEGAFVNGVPLCADSTCVTIDKAMVLTDVGYERSAKGARRLAACHEALLLANTFGVRVIGSTVLALAWVAAGRASAFCAGVHRKDSPKAWDFCAAKAIGDARYAHAIDANLA